MRGIEEEKRDPHKWFLDNVRNKFEHSYTLNVYSINKQYNDNVVPDEEKYDAEFEAYRKKGRDIWINKQTGLMPNVMPWQEFRWMMWNFFSGVLYQIEDEYSYRELSSWFHICLYRLFADDIASYEGLWSEINLDVA